MDPPILCVMLHCLPPPSGFTQKSTKATVFFTSFLFALNSSGSGSGSSGLLALVLVSGEHYFRTFEDFHHLTLAGCLTDQHHFANSLSSAAEPCHLPFDTNLKKKQSMRHLSYCRSKARFCSHFSESYFWSLTRWFSKLPTRQMYILKFSSLADTSP